MHETDTAAPPFEIQKGAGKYILVSTWIYSDLLHCYIRVLVVDGIGLYTGAEEWTIGLIADHTSRHGRELSVI